jgi:hypothetical protein
VLQGGSTPACTRSQRPSRQSERAGAQPGDDVVDLGEREQIADRVARLAIDRTEVSSDQVELVVTEQQANRRRAPRSPSAERRPSSGRD